MDWKILLLIFGMTLISHVSPAQSYSISTVTNQNRNHHDMFGGWGPHLRSILRSTDDEQWMAIDDGAGQDHNDLIRYHKLAPNQKTWNHIGQANIAQYEIRQNLAHIMVGNEIHSYGVELVGLDNGSVTGNRIVQVKYNTQTNTSTSSYINVNFSGNGSNYIGASVNKTNGLEVVWWRRRPTANPPAELMVIWKYPNQSQWNGPKVFNTMVNGNAYTMFQYVYGTFTDDHRLELVGQSGNINVPGKPTFYVPAHQTINFTPSNATANGFTWLGNNATAANRVTDIWKNPCNNDLHVLAYASATGDAVYYYRQDGATNWTDWQLIGKITNRYDSKFSYDTHLDTLAIVNYDGGRFYSAKLRVAELTGPIDLNNLSTNIIPIAALNSGGASGLYVQREAMQTNPTTKFQFANVGKAFNYDHLIRYVRYDHVDLADTSSNACFIPPCPDLTPVITIVPTNLSGVSNLGIAVELYQLANNKTDGSAITVRIPVDPRYTFNWDASLTNVGFTPVNNAEWVYTSTNGLFYEFEYAGVLSQNQKSAFGVIGSYDPQQTTGITSVTATVVPGGSNECEFGNNTDAEVIYYFD